MGFFDGRFLASLGDGKPARAVFEGVVFMLSVLSVIFVCYSRFGKKPCNEVLVAKINS
jgi:hypothetical protein